MIPLDETMRARLQAMPASRNIQRRSQGYPGPGSPFSVQVEEFIKGFPGHQTLGTPGTVVAYGAGLFLLWKLLK